jgi:hypothetical protein
MSKVRLCPQLIEVIESLGEESGPDSPSDADNPFRR